MTCEHERENSCHLLELTYGTNDTSISDHARTTEHVQQRDVLHVCGSALRGLLWYHTVARAGVS